MSTVSTAVWQVENVTVARPVAGTTKAPVSDSPAATSSDAGLPQLNVMAGGEPVTVAAIDGDRTATSSGNTNRAFPGPLEATTGRRLERSTGPGRGMA